MAKPNRSRLLYVEDQDDLRDIVGKTLVAEGFDVTAVGGAREALLAIEARPFEFVLTDYQLADATAAWLLEQAGARGLLQGVPVLVVTSEAHPVGVRGAPIVRKPVDPERLAARVRSLLGASAPKAPSVEAALTG